MHYMSVLDQERAVLSERLRREHGLHDGQVEQVRFMERLGT
jgi:hypothetical protein